MVSAAPTSPVAGADTAAIVVALAAALGSALGWGGARLCDSLVRFFLLCEAQTERERERE